MTILVLSVSFIYLHFYFEIILDLPKSCRKKRERERDFPYTFHPASSNIFNNTLYNHSILSKPGN